MSSNLNKPKVRVAIALAMIALVVILVKANIIPKIVSIKDTSLSIIQGKKYNLTLKTTANFSDQTIKAVDILWAPNKVGSRTVGAQDFIGTVKNYEKKRIMQVIVKPKPIVKSKQIGYISKVYEKSGKRYLKFDDVRFLTGDEAIEEAKKSGEAIYEDGKYYVYDDYIVVNTTKEIKSYILADNASLNLIGWWLDSINGDINNHSVSYDKFKKISNKYKHMLCYIYTENGVVVKVEGQYTP